MERGEGSRRPDLRTRLQEFREQERGLSWDGTFLEYFDLVRGNPRIARLAHARVCDMIMAAGRQDSEIPDDSPRHPFFTKELFGLEKPLAQLVDYFSSAARRLEIRKRILLFMGPVGGGKSTIVLLLKRGLEQYTRTRDGAMYAIRGCPMHEEPLHLIPETMRAEIVESYGIHIEGDLCPVCRNMVERDYNGSIEDVRVERVFFSEKNRIGIGTFSPSDPKSQDITELTGSIDLARIGEFGVESDPRAYRFDGELNVANRGLMEFIEILKSDERFLYGLLTLSQEQSIKTGRFAMIYADEVVVSHTNEAEYNRFIGDQRSEALQDRMIVIRIPYNLRVREEVKIYEKLIQQSNLTDVHIAPHTLEIASVFAVLSRLEAPKKAGMTLMEKLKLYDGAEIDNFTQKDIRELRDQAPREGMEGISPRYIMNCLSKAMVHDGTTCINPIDALRSLRDGLEQHTSILPEGKENLLNLIREVRKEYDERAKTAVQRAFVYSFEESTQTLFNNYLDNVEAYCSKAKVRDPITDEEVEPDEKLMRSIEEQIDIAETGKKTFREEMLIRISTLARRGERLTYTSHERLREAIEKKLFADLRDVVKITTSTKTPDAEQLRRMNEVANRLIAEEGYCATCANNLLQYVGTLLNR